ncbi:hypothetical protein CUMW_007960, partial [Citrus unshiu]
MKMNFGVGSLKLLLSSSLLFAHLFLLICLSNAQNNTTATTDPAEVRALNSILQQWDAPAVPLWNISGEPCSGSALNATDSEFESPDNNPAIVCDCTFDNGATCHITKLRVYALNKKGVIPEELVTLQYLTFLKIDQNFFTGPMPSFIGNLSRLMLLSVAHNGFSGPVPRELGNLKELTILSFGTNNFSGTLPPELGNLAKLEQLYINSCGAGGEIPSTFAKLRSMQTLWASDAPFTGKIPDFIGNWTKLKSLRFQGNSFQGPIPSSLSKLASLESLRISDIYNVSSSLDFVMSLKNLTDLSLRHALITGTIPSRIGDLQMLQILDLSFNNLTGQIPATLFNISSLNYLFLGNNSLSGTLPDEKSEKLQKIDLSHNHLSGTFPSWATSELQMNLAVNNFKFDISNISVFPGLSCLQRNFPCNRNAPQYANFSIKCGSPEMRADNIVYEGDNSYLGASAFVVTNTEKWAVSKVGLFNERENPAYVLNTLAQVTGTRTPELYQTSRISAGSLRYYGLGLVNGPYNVSLLFAETNFPDPSTERWESLGRRVFDIYVQGRLQWKDFDISKEAGGPNRAIIKNFSATVSENHLEIHLFWAGKGTCCIPEQGNYGPAISALSVVSAFPPTASGLPPSTPGKKSHTGLIVGIAVPLGILGSVVISIVFYIRREKDNDDEEVLVGIGSKPNIFSYAELRSATKDFDPSNKLGEGGYGPVYKGTLSDGRVIAVKQLSIASHQGKNQFVNEIATISAVQHRNLVRLYGCCIEGARRLLVYEYLENKSLDQVLFGDHELRLDWPTRFSICLGTARGLAYLHEESRPRIVHRDVKASNILLDAELCPKISDFGLAKLFDDKKTHISTRVAGTIGYLAPEYAMRGHLTEKADVFSFGVVALEMISGRANSDNSLDTEKIYLLEWAWNLHENNQSLGLVDPTLTEFNDKEALRVIGVALLCTQASPMMRPPMSRVVAMLAGDVEVGTVISRPSYLTDWDFKDITASFLNEDTPTPSSSNKRSNRKEKSERENPVDDHSEGTNALVSPLAVAFENQRRLAYKHAVRALNSILQQWDAPAAPLWNISGNPCSGSALNATDSEFESPNNNPAIVCNCTFDNGATCHITKLRVYGLNKKGVIPEELVTLQYLTVLKIDQNFFTGPLPSFIGNLSRLMFLSFSHNDFSGPVPRELGNLKELTVLAFGTNNFSGALPPELGNLAKLEQLYIDSCGAGGEIPSTFAKLRNMQTLWASDNPFTGKIPDFIGNWTKLKSLRFQGNSFQGPIPSSLSKLASLESLQMGDIYNVSSSLDFVMSLKNLTDLSLRNALITGTIPSGIGELQMLQILDLSFNNLTGQIPATLFTIDSLEYLFLGNNSLSGTLPDQKSENLQKMNFSIVDANFSIKCASPEMRADNIVYEGDNSYLGASAFVVTNTEKWAVSKVGLFNGRENASYVLNTQDQVTGTRTPKLYQTSRISAGSLRYYGLGLVNGPYNGTLRWKDFDISKEAGGPNRAIIKNFSATVSENHLEIHLFWAGKGTCCIPKQGNYGPAISALSVVSAFKPSVSGLPPSTPGNKNHTGLIVGIAVPLGILGLIVISIMFYLWREKDNDDEEVLVGIGSKPNIFGYAELRSATKDFNRSNKLGEGGYGPVYKGTLSDGRVIAVKQLSIASHQGKNQFVNEIATISAVQHRNLVRLYGCCIEGARHLLVYEYLENKSLDQVFFGDNELHLDWPTRFSICLGTARGLAYLHEESRPRIVHRDVKASNILLDAELCPKISDFGLAKLYDDKKTHISTRVSGTVGYLAPEYAMRGHLTEKADVFSFGVVALEIISGRANSDNSLDMEKIYLLEWAWNLHENNQSLGLVDPTLTEFNDKEALRVIGVALLCTQTSPMMRPPMSRVVAMLAGDIEVGTVVSKPSYLTGWDFKDITASFLNEDTPTPSSSNKRSNSKEKSQRENPVDDHSEGIDALLFPVNVTQLAVIVAEGSQHSRSSLKTSDFGKTSMHVNKMKQVLLKITNK